MPLPSEYVIEDAVRSIDDVIVYSATHPIHGRVNVYLPDETLPPAISRAVRKRLYQNGLQMRNMSMQDVPLATKALEVSQNPNEPYIVTKYAKHDLESFISNGVTVKPKRMFAILTQVLEAIVNLSAAGWEMDRIHPRQIKLADVSTGDISFTVIEGAEQPIEAEQTGRGDLAGTTRPIDAAQQAAAVTAKITQPIDEPGEVEEPAPQAAAPPDVRRADSLEEDTDIAAARKLSRSAQRNVYLLGNLTYQLLFVRTSTTVTIRMKRCSGTSGALRTETSG
jgi:hypothetical protein